MGISALLKEVEEVLEEAYYCRKPKTIREILSNDKATEVSGLNPYCMNEGRANGDEEYGTSFILPVVDKVKTARKLYGWQPIETAPKDGTFILTATPALFGDGYKIHMNKWNGDAWQYAYTNAEKNHLTAPTHWMYLPEGPE